MPQIVGKREIYRKSIKLNSKNINNSIERWLKDMERCFWKAKRGKQVSEKVLDITNHQGNVNKNKGEI